MFVWLLSIHVVLLAILRVYLVDAFLACFLCFSSNTLFEIFFVQIADQLPDFS